MKKRTPFVPPTMAGISAYYSDMTTKYYIKAKDLIKATIAVAVIIIALHLIFR